MGDSKKVLGSNTAKKGFKNEKDIESKFNLWKNDVDAQEWLKIMGYDIFEIEYVKASVLKGYKADINVVIQVKFKNKIDIENIQIKLVSNRKGYNQVDKRWLKKYKEMWNIPSEVYKLLQYFVGEILPYKKDTKDERRMFLTEFSEKDQNALLSWFDKNKLLIITDILKGRGEFSAEWLLVVQKTNENTKWVLKNINEVLNYYFDNGKVRISIKGSLNIGKITMQRKGGDAGRKTSQMLQFKIDPTEIFDIIR